MGFKDVQLYYPGSVIELCGIGADTVGINASLTINVARRWKERALSSCM